MKLKIAALMTGSLCLQALLLSSGCTNHNTLAPRGYIPAADIPPGTETAQQPQQQQQQQLAPTQQQPQQSQPMEVEEISVPSKSAYTPPQETMHRQPERPVVAAPEKYVVKKGDTLSQIGQQYGVGAAALASYNNLDIKKPIRIGQTIVIPPPGTVISIPRKTQTAATSQKATKTTKAASTQAAAKTSAAASATGMADGYYLVKKGDSVSKIAANYKVKRADLMKANNINENTILKIGQKLVIPGKSPATAQAVAATKKPATGTAATTAAAAPRKTTAPAPVATQMTPTPTPTPSTSSATADDILGDLRDPVAAPVTPTPTPTPTPAPTTSTPAATTAAPVSAAPIAPTAPASSLLPQKTSIEAPSDTTLENIAAAYGTTVDDLKKLNPDLKDSKVIQAGRVIFIPLAP